MDLRNKVPFFMNYASGYMDTVSGVSPLSLPKAKANSLQYVKAFGGTEQSGTPTPDYPIDIVSNNGVVKYGVIGKNLFNPTKVLFGYYRDRTTGDKMQSSQNFMSSDDGYIPCLPNTTYTFAGTNKTDGTYSKYNTIYFFDSAKNYLGASPYEISQPTTGTTPNNCYYLQVRSNPLDISFVSIQDAFAQFNWQLEQGSTTTAYEPYKEGIYTDGTVETIWAHGKNLFDSTPYKTGYYIDASGNDVEASQYQEEYLIRQARVQPLTQYTISFKGVVSGYTQRIHAYDAAGNWLSQIAAISAITPDVVSSASLITPANCAYVRQGGRSQTEYQLERGSTATTYEPYFDGGTATAEMLLKVGDYQDVQSIIDGVVTRNVGVKVLDGTEHWQNISGYFNISKTDIGSNSTVLPSGSTDIICTHYETISGVPNRTSVNVGGSYINFKDDNIPTLAGFKQWLADQYAAGTPVTIIYPLATPTTDSVTGQTLQVQAGTNTLEITQASLNNLELEAKYRRNK